MRYSMTIAAAALFAASAGAGPVTTPPAVITALGGDVKAVYVFADAGDTSLLSFAATTLFCNHNSGSCTANSAGNTKDLGIITAGTVMKFVLDDTTTGKTYDSVNPDSDGNYHARVTSNYADFGVGGLPSAAGAALAGLTNVTFVGFEDHNKADGSDWDYNDLIFAFSNTKPSGNPGVPEPLTLSLMGAGLLGAFGLRRVKKS